MTCTAKSGPAAECPYRGAPTVAEAARVLLEASAHTLPNITIAAANEFGPLGFMDAAVVVGAALRALAGEGQR